jgi:hypothetical protein
MKPEYWIGIMAVVGGIIGYALFKETGWLDAGIGAVVGILIGGIIYNLQKGTRKSQP